MSTTNPLSSLGSRPRKFVDVRSHQRYGVRPRDQRSAIRAVRGGQSDGGDYCAANAADEFGFAKHRTWNHQHRPRCLGECRCSFERSARGPVRGSRDLLQFSGGERDSFRGGYGGFAQRRGDVSGDHVLVLQQYTGEQHTCRGELPDSSGEQCTGDGHGEFDEQHAQCTRGEH